MVTSVSSTVANASNKISTGSTQLFDNFETFLTLLTTQLKNQDPLSPMDSNEFTAQLTDMAGVEQQLLTNDLLNSMLAAQTGNGLSNAAAFIGKEGTAVWGTTRLEGGNANWSYELGGNATNVSLEVLNASGQVVWRGTGDGKADGMHDFNWNGKTTGGGQLSDGGVYTLRVTATDALGATVPSQTLIRGRISGVEMYNDTPYVVIGNSILPMDNLLSLEERTNAASGKAAAEDETSALGTFAKAINPFSYLS